MALIARIARLKIGAGITALALAGAAVFQLTPQPPAGPEPWPAFTMVYQEETHPDGFGWPAQTDTYRLDYTDRAHWTQTLLDSTRDPRSVGSTTRIDGGAFQLHDMGTQPDVIEKNSGWVAPSDWLVPGQMRWIADQGFTRAADQPVAGRTLVTHSEPYHRQDTSPRCVDPESGGTLTTEIAFSDDAHIPLERTERVGSFILRHIVVIGLAIDGQ